MPGLTRGRDEYLLSVGPMDATKGPQRAIAAAARADVPLAIAGAVQPGQALYERAAAGVR